MSKARKNTRRSGRPADDVDSLLRRAIGAGNRAGESFPYAIGGAMAMAAHGYERTTKDVDVYVAHGDHHAFLRALRDSGMTVIPIFEPHHYAAYVPGTTDQERRIDVLVPSGEPELSAIEWAEEKELFGVSVPVFPLDLLVFAKAYSSRSKDEHDIASMLGRGMFDPANVAAIIQSVDKEGAAEFRALIKRITAPKKARTKPTKRIPRKKP